MDIVTGAIVDKKVLIADYTYLTGSSGVHLFNDTLSILSIQNQCVHLYRILDSGVLEKYNTIGYHKNETEQDIITTMLDAEDSLALDSRLRKRTRMQYRQLSTRVARPRDSIRLSGVKHSLMAFLFKRARDSGDSEQMKHFCNILFILTLSHDI